MWTLKCINCHKNNLIKIYWIINWAGCSYEVLRCPHCLATYEPWFLWSASKIIQIAGKEYIKVGPKYPVEICSRIDKNGPYIGEQNKLEIYEWV